MDHLQADAIALSLLGHDVALVADDAMSNPTPCDGWTVADLVRHMNQQHEEIISTVLEPFDSGDDDPRSDFSLIGARWIAAVQQAGDEIEVPKAGGFVRTSRVIDIHFVDMLVHRWDLAKALQLDCHVPALLTDLALPIGRSITGPGTALNGPGGVYNPPHLEGDTLAPIDNLAALLGRDPRRAPEDWSR